MFRESFIATATFALVAFAGGALAAVDVNDADATRLQTVDGLGPVVAERIVAERKGGAFKDWDDLVERVPGIGEKNASRFSSHGLTVGGVAKPVRKLDPNLMRRTNPAATKDATSKQ